MAKNLEEIKDVCDAVEDLVQKWENVNYDGASNGSKRKETEFEALQKLLPETYEILISEKSFWKLKAPFEKLDEGTYEYLSNLRRYKLKSKTFTNLFSHSCWCELCQIALINILYLCQHSLSTSIFALSRQP